MHVSLHGCSPWAPCGLFCFCASHIASPRHLVMVLGAYMRRAISTTEQVTLDGKTKTARAWAEDRGLSWAAVWTRRSRGESWPRALDPTPREDAVQQARNAKCICSATHLVTMDGTSKTVSEWAAERRLKLQTVKMRRYRGAGWAAALNPELRARRWMDGFMLSAG